MRAVLLTHSLASDWNHGNAHFQRGVLAELQSRGHRTLALEPEDGWSRGQLVADQGLEALTRFSERFPDLKSRTYRGFQDVEAALEGADLVIVHEWTDPEIANRIGRLRTRGAGFTLLFHDTHHRAVSAPAELARFDLDGYDAVLAFGQVLAEAYRDQGWGRHVEVWHEAADTRVFFPREGVEPDGDLVWIGNWGDGERERELLEFFVEPAARLGLKTTAYGVRYPQAARQQLAEAGIEYRGWAPNADVPEIFARHKFTLHVPRRQYVRDLPGIPTIRMFEALACGVPLIAAPWSDREDLFRPGRDYLTAVSSDSMRTQMRRLMLDRDLAAELAASGLETIRARHTCAHRVDELLAMLARIHPRKFAPMEAAR